MEFHNDRIQHPRILVVDDERTHHFLMRETLDPETYRVECVDSGSAALLRMEAKTPDLVILDVIMPEMDGFAVCERMRSNATLIDVPVLMTGFSSTLDKERTAELGVSQFLTKPIALDEFTRVVTRLLS